MLGANFVNQSRPLGVLHDDRMTKQSLCYIPVFSYLIRQPQTPQIKLSIFPLLFSILSSLHLADYPSALPPPLNITLPPTP